MALHVHIPSVCQPPQHASSITGDNISQLSIEDLYCLLQIINPVPEHVRSKEHCALDLHLHTGFQDCLAAGDRSRLGIWYEDYAVAKLSLGGSFPCRTPDSGKAL